MTPEGKAREQTDAQLSASGWAIQTKDKINLSASRGVAVCELSFATGEPDCTLFVDGKAMGTVEAKPAGYSLVGVEEQSTKYVTGAPASLLAWHNPLPFYNESTGAEIPLPSLAERTRIVAEVERRLSVVEELESVVSANLQRAVRLRQSILQKAFTGELV